MKCNTDYATGLGMGIVIGMLLMIALDIFIK